MIKGFQEFFDLDISKDKKDDFLDKLSKKEMKNRYERIISIWSILCLIWMFGCCIALGYGVTYHANYEFTHNKYETSVKGLKLVNAYLCKEDYDEGYWSSEYNSDYDEYKIKCDEHDIFLKKSDYEDVKD